MIADDDDTTWPDDEAGDDEPVLDDSELQTEAVVTCPWCGEAVEITLDPAGGAVQEYVQDCEICCRPWNVHVAYDEEGVPDVWLSEAG